MAMNLGYFLMWIFGTILIFIAAVSWMAFTPFYTTFSGSISTTNFADAGTNSSFHNSVTYNANMWNIWPVVIIVVVIIFIIIYSHDEEPNNYGRV